MKRSVVAVLVLLGVAVAAGGGYWLGQSRPGASVATPGTPGAAAAAKRRCRGLPSKPPRWLRRRCRRCITAVGSLRSDESVTLRPEVAGRVSAIQFKEGQPIAKGTTMVRLDPAINEAEYEQAKANLWLAKTKHERAIDLQKQGFISSQAKDEAENNLRLAEAAIALARSAAREDRDQGALLGGRRPALGVARRLREGGPGPRQSRVDRSAQGRFPRARGLPEAGRRRADAGDRPRRASRARPTRARCSRSIRWSTRAAGRS